VTVTTGAMMTGTGTAGLVPAGSGRTLFDGPLGAVLLAGGEQTGGSVAFVVHPLAPRALGSPVHTHHREDEWSYVLEGEIGVQLGDDVVRAGPGDLVLKPRGVPHAFWNPGDVPARLLEVITPAGFEGYFERIGELLSAPGAPDLEAIAAAGLDVGLDLDPASVPRLVEAHGLRMEG
jgi:mannose-6-phosphate isomerase-like protein (cupin superfamily)